VQVEQEDDNDEEEEEDVEEVGVFFAVIAVARAQLFQIAPLPVRVLRNLVGRFWGGPNLEEEGSSDDGLGVEAELDGVD
jgi:hypothetical protein